jgi:hypothetical protein
MPRHLGVAMMAAGVLTAITRNIVWDMYVHTLATVFDWIEIALLIGGLWVFLAQTITEGDR